MRLQIVTRHCEVPSRIRARAEEHLTRLTRYESRLSSASVVFEIEGHSKRVEAILSVDGVEPVVAHGEGDEFAPALEQMVGRLAKILRRRRDQARDHQAPKLSELAHEGD